MPGDNHNPQVPSVMVAVVSMLVIAVFWMPSVEADQREEVDDEIGECDRFVESYVRSSARKLWRPLARGEYGLEPVDLDETFEVEADEVGADESIEFEVFKEEGGVVVGLVDIRREWEKTYLVAEASFGPIVISQTWQPRHLRRTQACEPIASTVEWPSLIASSVDIEPFRFWGLRASWRIPSPETAESTEATLREVLIDVIGGHGEVE